MVTRNPIARAMLKALFADRRAAKRFGLTGLSAIVRNISITIAIIAACQAERDQPPVVHVPSVFGDGPIREMKTTTNVTGEGYISYIALGGVGNIHVPTNAIGSATNKVE